MDLPDVDNTEEFRCISLCSGYAGIELGIRRVIPNLRTVAYVEREGFACANLVAKIEAGKLDAAPIWTDIKTFDGRPFYKRVHIITAGYPCQGESVAGKRLKERDPRWLWPYIERIIEAVRPVWCFFENVSGHLTGGYPTVYRSLRLMGYKVEAGLFTATEVGAPHKRQRLFILANAGYLPRCTEHRQQQKECAEKFSGGCDLAVATSQRIQRPEPEGTTQAGRQIDEQSYRWPSRPGQPQYEWEKPRVVEYARKQKSEGVSQSEKRNCNRKAGNSGRQGQTQSRLGRAVARTSSRMDRLRLLGNGVVPQQAELAFRVLTSTFAKAFFEVNR